ncbi:hypothetical protein FWK35_00020804 [Aphis craccivora]|uniref:Uncharacterized protein n=1 Tax=Aphis craccivora TaxID=307492 RepID=A0A6G0WGR1_APHCR|nr:hypothetical protein FWK35_00020804 [Aphis craccivora]
MNSTINQNHKVMIIVIYSMFFSYCEYFSDTFEFFNNSVGTQANIVNASVGCIDSALEYFCGYQLIKNEKYLISIAGINQEILN